MKCRKSFSLSLFALIGLGVTAAAPASNVAEHVHKVSITGFKMDPETIEILAGDEVEWINNDFVAHTATAKDGTFDTGRIDSNQSKRIKLTKVGSFPYYCRFHSSMKGTVTVK
jgi:plastocyanin